MNAQKYHLLNDFGIYKATIKRNFNDNDRDETFNDVQEMLDRRTQFYTLAEAQRLGLFLWTAHDDCVDAHPDDFSPVQVYTSRKKIKDGLRALDLINTLAQDEKQWKLMTWTDRDGAPVACIAFQAKYIREALEMRYPKRAVAREPLEDIDGPGNMYPTHFPIIE